MLDPWQSAGPRKETGALRSAVAAGQQGSPTLFDSAASSGSDDGRRRRDDGRRAAVHNTFAPYKARFLECIEQMPEDTELTSETVTGLIGEPYASSKNALGGLMASAARAGLVERIGHVQSAKPSRHGAWVILWRRVA